MVNQEPLETSTVIGHIADKIQTEVHNSFIDGVMSTGDVIDGILFPAFLVCSYNECTHNTLLYSSPTVVDIRGARPHRETYLGLFPLSTLGTGTVIG